jgi:hypothetical protein
VLKVWCRQPIDYMSGSRDSMRPKGNGKFGLREKSKSTLNEVSVLSLCNSILLWGVRARQLMENTMISTELIESCGCEFSSTISTKYLDWERKLSTDHGLKFRKHLKGV